LFQAIFIAIAATLIATGIYRYVIRRRLYFVSPRLYDYSGLMDASRTVELIIINLGRRAEHDIKLELAPAFKYTLLAGTSSGLEINADGVLNIDRIPPKDEVSLIFLAEGNAQFKAEDITALSSRDCKGKLSDSVQEAQTSGPAAAVGVFVIFCMMYGFGKFGEVFLWPAIASSSVVSGFDTTIEKFDICSSDFNLYNNPEGNALPTEANAWVQLLEVRQRFSTVYVELKISNHFNGVASVSVRAESSASKDGFFASLWGSDISEQLIIPGDSETITVGAYLPEDFLVQSLSLIVYMNTQDDLRLFSKHRIGLNKTKARCSS